MDVPPYFAWVMKKLQMISLALTSGLPAIRGGHRWKPGGCDSEVTGPSAPVSVSTHHSFPDQGGRVGPSITVRRRLGQVGVLWALGPKSRFVRVDDCVDAVAGTQLGEDIGDVALHGLGADVEGIGDLLI